MSAGKHEVDANQLLCEDCQLETEDSEGEGNGLLMRGAVLIGTLLIVFLLRSLDTVLQLLIRASTELMIFRPLVPVYAAYQSAGADLVFLVILVAAFIFVLNLTLPIPLLDLVTFPGTIVHEWAHLQACRYYGLHVYEVVYFQLDSVLGYVRYEVPEDPFTELGVAGAPLIFNSVIALGIAAIATVVNYYIGPNTYFLLLWLAFSVGVGAFPSNIDVDNVWGRILREWKSRPRILVMAPLALLLYLANIFRLAFVEVVYAISLVFVGTSIGVMFLQ